MELLPDYFSKRLLDSAVASVRDYVSDRKASFSAVQRLDEALEQHLKHVNEWSALVSFRDLRSPKSLGSVFVDLDLFAYPRSVRIDEREVVETLPFSEIVAAADSHIVLLGQPGAGKTTSLKFICRQLLETEGFIPHARFPLLLPLRHLDSSVIGEPDPLFAGICRILGIIVRSPQSASVADATALRARACLKLLATLQPLVVLDGFDELSPNRRTTVLQDLSVLATGLDRGHLILTARTGEFAYAIDGMAAYETRSSNTSSDRDIRVQVARD